MQKQNENFHNPSLGARTIKIFAPATIANLGCGFDVVGMALNYPHDERQLILNDNHGSRIRHTDVYNLPTLTE